jgi:hypothetical protein
MESQDDKILARYDFVVTFGKRYQEEFRQNYDERLEKVINEMHESLSTDFTRFVRELLGDEVSVRIDKLESGSIVGTITLVLVSALSVYTYISQYHDFVESLELIRDQLYSKVTRVLGRGNNLWDTTISIVITKIPYQTQSQPAFQQEPPPVYSKAFFWYLFISNILLIMTLGFLLYKAVVFVYFAP